MNIKVLEYALELARQKNFTATAQKFYITQPALTKHIAQLERTYRMTLFDRSTRSVSLTKNGEIFISYAKKVVEAWTNLEDAMHELTEQVEHSLSIGLFVQSEFTPIPAIIADYTAENPHLHISVSASTEQHLVADLKSGNLDVIFLRCYAENLPNGLNAIPILSDPIHVLVNAEDELCNSPYVSRTALTSYRLICENESFSNSYDLLKAKFNDELLEIAPPSVCIENSSVLPHLLSVPGSYSFTTQQSGKMMCERFPNIQSIPLANSRPVTTYALYLPQNKNKNISFFWRYLQDSYAEKTVLLSDSQLGSESKDAFR